MAAMAYRSRTLSPAMAGLFLVCALAGCAMPDRRLTEDETSCRGMGHTPDTPPFRECLRDLNDRRCAVAPRKIGTPQHMASNECTRIN